MRSRLFVAVAVVAAAVAGAGAPSILAASDQLSDSQHLVTLGEQTEDALTLSHSLADERDEVTSYIAAGRPKSKAPSDQRSARVDRQVDEMRADVDTPTGVRADLTQIASVRRAALTGKSTALEAHAAYSAIITELHRTAEDLAQRTPARAGSGAYALAELDTAVQQAAAARGLLLAALNVPHSTQSVMDPVTGIWSTGPVSTAAQTKQRDALSAAAQQARLRSDAALADFRDTAPKSARDDYDSTVTGSDADAADKYLAALTDEPKLSEDDLGTSLKKADAALTGRVDLMSGVESSLYHHRTTDLARLRDDDVTALEIRVAALGVLLLVAVGIATGLARSLTRPLAVVRIGSARLAGAEDAASEEPIRFTGRNDEFAQVVRSVNALHAHAVALQERVTTLEGDRKHLVGQRQSMADARDGMRAELSASAQELERLRASIGSTFVNLALRTLGLVERQLAVIESMEEREQDPDRLGTLFKLDHFATVMRRHSENLLVLAGTEHGHQHAGAVPLVDVVRAAVSEIERYERVRIAALPPHAHVVGFAADDLSHLLAELMENATAFSPPDQPVEVSGWLLQNGEVMLSVQDEGIGMTAERMDRLNTRLAEFEPDAAYEKEDEDGLGLGLYVVARLAHRHGTRVQLREQRQGGIAAVVVLPTALLAVAPASAVPADHLAGGPPTALPGADAEANSNVLNGRSKGGDPLVALAEQAVRRSGVDEPANSRAAEGTSEPANSSAAEGTSERANSAEADGTSKPVGSTAPYGTTADANSPTDTPTSTAAPAPAERPAETTMELLLPGPTSEDSAGAPPAPRPAADPTGQPSAPGPAAPAADPYAIGPDAHERVPDPRGPLADEPREQITGKGLPKRTPKITAPTETPRPRTGSVDAAALRRRLGGFRSGADAGRREAEAEIADRTAPDADAPEAGTGAAAGTGTGAAAPAGARVPQARTPQADEATGGTVEEASS